MRNPEDSHPASGIHLILAFWEAVLHKEGLFLYHECWRHQRILKKGGKLCQFQQKMGLDTVEKLSASDMEELKWYLESLVWKSEIPTENLENPQNSSKLKRKGRPKRILAALNKSHDVTPEDAVVLLNAIKEGEIPMRFDSVFNESVSVTGIS